MTREERKAFNSIKADFNKIVRPLVKPYGFRTSGGRIWSKQGELLLIMHPVIGRTDKTFLHTTCCAKPLFADDYLWDILGFEKSRRTPFSKRVTGDCAVQGVRFYSNDHLLHKSETEETERFLKEELERFSQHIQAVSADGLSWFRQMEAEQERYWQCDVMRLILLIHQGKKDKALEYINEHQMRELIIDGRSFGELALAYLKGDAR